MLGPKDDETGHELFYTIIKDAAEHIGMKGLFIRISSAAELIPALQMLRHRCRRDGLMPVLHIESHGNTSGLAPNGGRLVSWSELRPVLIDINLETQLNLFVTMAACYGAYFVQTIHPEEPAPFWGLIGPTEKVDETEIRAGFQAFYRRLMRDQNVDMAMEELKSSVKKPAEWVINAAEIALAFGFGEYAKRYGRPGELSAQDSEMFDRFRERFLMIDRFRDNNERFPITAAEAIRIYKEYYRPPAP